MSDTNHEAPTITFRIPGAWSHPGELLERLPEGYQLTPDALILPDGTSIDFHPRPPDGQFPGIFQSACRGPLSRTELETLSNYTVNVILNGPGGSMESALTMMQAASAIIRAGAAGVFIDNSAMAHGGKPWLQMTEDGGPEAISFAFTALLRGDQDVYTMGMHTMGFPDLLMRRSDIDEQGETIIEIIRYICGSNRPVGVGHVLADDQGRVRFQIVSQTDDDSDPDSPMHNPFGRLKIVSAKDVAEGN